MATLEQLTARSQKQLPSFLDFKYHFELQGGGHTDDNSSFRERPIEGMDRDTFKRGDVIPSNNELDKLHGYRFRRIDPHSVKQALKVMIAKVGKKKPAEEEEGEPEEFGDGLEKLTIRQLFAYAEDNELQVDLDETMKKNEVLRAIREATA